MSRNESDKPTNNRFWEFYFVRYFVGTVLGAGIVFFLNTNTGSVLNGKIIPELTDISKLSGEGLTLLAAIGLAYCYIASAPVLVLHATRGVFLNNKTTIFSWVMGVALALIAVLSVWSHYFFQVTNNKLFLSYVLFSLVLSLQLLPLIFALRNEGHALHDYYTRLTIARSRKSPYRNEYVESYRHLREHGNAFFILLFAFILGIILWSSTEIELCLIALLVWIMPASCVWVVGSVLEFKFANENQT